MAIRYPTDYDKVADIPADLEDMAESIQDELDLKVDKVQGKGLSTNDYTNEEKQKLAEIESGAQVNVIEAVKVNGTALTPSNKAVDVPVPTQTSDLTNDSGFIDKDVNNLTNYYDKNEVDTKIASVYKYKGTVSTYNDLPSTNLTVGDVYNIETADSTHSVKAGDNVAWNGTAWDVLAGTVDLSGYQTKIDSSHKLESDLVDDTNSTHKFVTSEEKTQISTNATDIDNIKDGTEIDSFGDVETVLAEKQEQIDDLVEENSILKKQIPTTHISTTSTQLTDSAEDMPIEHVKIKGATSQQQYEGYNLWNGTRRAINGTVVDEVVETTALSYHGWFNVYSDQAISLSANQDYYLSCELRIKSGSAEKLNYFRPTDYPADSTKVFVQNPNLSSNYQRFICKVTATTAVEVGGFGLQITDGTDAVLECKNFMISTTNATYEPYTGGQASPNPSYPQDIHRVTGECNEKVQNKNFLPNLATSRSVNGINFVVNEDKSVTINGTATQSAYLVLTNSTNNLNNYRNKVFTMPDEFLRFPTGSNSVNYGFRDTSGNYLSNNALANQDIGLVYLNVVSGATIDNLTVYPQIEEGTTLTEYIPHSEQNAPLTLGNTELYEDDEIEIDYVQKAGYKKVTGARFVKNMGKYVFTGNENFSNPNTNQYNISGLPISFYTAINVAIGFSNLLKTIPTKETDSEFYTYVTNNNLDNVLNFHKTGNAIRTYTTTCTTLQEFKNMISQLGFYIVYKLATPVTAEITDPTLLAQLEKLINMKTYKEVTNIDLTGEDLAPVLDCDYYQDMSTLNDRLDELEARIELLEE